MGHKQSTTKNDKTNDHNFNRNPKIRSRTLRRNNTSKHAPKTSKHTPKTSNHKTSNHNLKQSTSGLVGDQSERESLSAWVREGVHVTEVYNIHEIIGHGHLGAITIVTRKKKENGFSQHHRTMSSNSLRAPASPLNAKKKVSMSHGPPSFGSSDSDEPVSGRPRLESFASEATVKRDRMYACKTVSTARMQAGQMEELLNEVRIMRDLDHPHILHLFEVYYVKRRMWLIMELCTGGDLFARLDTNAELDVCLVMEQICRAVVYMHRRGVCHRDIKLENILYEHSEADAGIKLIDFGLAQKFTRGTKMLQACGTVYSVAPELVLGEGYTEMSDIWSIGCVAFILLSGGKFPFLTDHEAVHDKQQRERLLQAEYEFGPEWDGRRISSEGREFVRRCLRKEPSARDTARDMLDFIRNQWEPALEESDTESDANNTSHTSHSSGSDIKESSLKEYSQVGSDTSRSSRSVIERRRRTKVGSQTLKGMKDFCSYGQLKKRVLMIMAHTMDKSSVGELNDLFIAMDSEGTGTISVKEMRDAIQRMYDGKSFAEIQEEDIDNMFKGIDQDQSGQIHYAEFLAAVLESQGLITMELLGEAFDRIDTEGKGYISKDDLRAILGRDNDEELVNRMIEEADFKKNGKVDYDEFLDLMFEDPAGALEMFSSDNMVDSIRSLDGLEWSAGN